MATKDIVQNIKIKVDKSSSQKDLTTLKSKLNDVDKASSQLNSSFIKLGVAAAGAFAILNRGFNALASDERSLNNLSNAINNTGTAADLNAERLFKYFDTIQRGTGQSADNLAQIASQFIQIGITSQDVVKKLVTSSIGLADRNKISTQQASDAIIKGLQGQTRGLKGLRLNIQAGASAQQALNIILKQGAQSYQNLNNKSSFRLSQRFKQDVDDMIKSWTVKFLPAINGGLQFIINNMDTIGNILVTGGIFVGLKMTLHTIQLIGTSLGLNLGLTEAEIKAVLEKLAIQRQILTTKVQQGTATAATTRAIKNNQIETEVWNNALNKTKGIGGALKAIFSSTNIILLAASITAGLIYSNFDKIQAIISKTGRTASILNKQTAQLKNNLSIDQAVVQKRKALSEQWNNAIQIQKSLRNKLNLTKEQTNKLKQSFDVLTSKMPELKTSSNNYKLSLISIKSASAQAKKGIDALAKSQIQLARQRQKINQNQQLSKLTNLPGTALSREASVNKRGLELTIYSPAGVNGKQMTKYAAAVAGYSSAIQSKDLKGAIKYANLLLTYFPQNGNIASGLQTAISQLTSLELQRNILDIRSETIPLSITGPDKPGPDKKQPKKFDLLDKPLIDTSYELDDALIVLLSDYGKLKTAAIEAYNANNMFSMSIKNNNKDITDLQKQKNALIDTVNKQREQLNAMTFEQQQNNKQLVTSMEKHQKEIDVINANIEAKKAEKDTNQQLINNNNEVVQSLQSIINSRIDLNKGTTLQKTFIEQLIVVYSTWRNSIGLTVQQIQQLDNKINVLNNRLKEISPKSFTQLFNESKEKLKPFSMELQDTFVNMAGVINQTFNSAFNGFGTALGQYATKQKSFAQATKFLWRDLAASVISQISAMIIKLLVLQAIELGLNWLVPGSGTGFMALLGMTGGKSKSTGNTSNFNSNASQDIPILNRNNSFNNKLDILIDTIQNWQPVTTHIIDLPTLGQTNRIANGMILEM